MLKWTDRGIAGHEGGASRKEYPDPSGGGLMLVVQPSGSKSWAWRGRHAVTKKPVKRTLGPYPKFGLADARQWAKEQLTSKSAGIDLGDKLKAEREAKAADEAVQAEASVRTLSWYFDTLYEPRFVAGTKDANEARRKFNKQIRPFLGDRPLSSITTDDLEDIVADLHERAPVSANRLVVYLRTMFKRGRRELRRQSGLLIDPAADLVKPHDGEKRRDRWLSEEEIGYLLTAMDRVNGPAERIHASMMLLILETSCRLRESLHARWEEFDWNEGIWTLPAGRSKNKLPHVMPLSKGTLDRLKERQRKSNSPWVFGSPVDSEKPFNGVSKAQRALRKKVDEVAGRTLDGWSAHTLRHTFITHMRRAAAQGVNPKINADTVEAAVNHVEGGVRGIYNHYAYLDEKKAIYRFWRDKLDKLSASAAAALAAEEEVDTSWIDLVSGL